ncbi:MAG: hypothetical protein QJR02_01500 [Sinobacteraceae bacterium]|nr:hypothetical protein [Nevskiaceae bacterium]
MRKVIVLKVVLDAGEGVSGEDGELAVEALSNAASYILRQTKALVSVEGTLLDISGYGPIKAVVEELPFLEE